MKKDNISLLEAKIESARSISKKKCPNSSTRGYHILSDLIAGLTVGSLLGYNLDVALNSKPLFLFLFVVLGVCGGFYNFYKLEMKKYSKK